MTEVPPPGVTVTVTVPAPGGEIAVIEVGDVTDTSVAGVEPKSTVDPVVNPEPVMVTVVPPLAGPEVGDIPLTTGV